MQWRRYRSRCPVPVSSRRDSHANQATLAGGPGVTQIQHDLGRRGPASFNLSWETYNIPDNNDVYYQGGLVFSTGYVENQTNEGTGSAVINLPTA